MFVEIQGVALGQVLDELAVAPGQGQRGGAHAVGDHEDEVALRTRAVVLGRRLVAVLEPDGDDDECRGGEEGPDEESDLADARGARRLLLFGVVNVRNLVIAMSVFAAEEGTLFGRLVGFVLGGILRDCSCAKEPSCAYHGCHSVVVLPCLRWQR